MNTLLTLNENCFHFHLYIRSMKRHSRKHMDDFVERVGLFTIYHDSVDTLLPLSDIASATRREVAEPIYFHRRLKTMERIIYWPFRRLFVQEFSTSCLRCLGHENLSFYLDRRHCSHSWLDSDPKWPTVGPWIEWKTLHHFWFPVFYYFLLFFLLFVLSLLHVPEKTPNKKYIRNKYTLN